MAKKEKDKVEEIKDKDAKAQVPEARLGALREILR